MDHANQNPVDLRGSGITQRLRMEYRRFDTLSPGLKHPKAYFNWLRTNYEMFRQSGNIKARPLKITFDPTNVCQLRCPLCPTGIGTPNREATRASLEAFTRLIDEVGDYVFFMDLFNWGEPLLNKHLTEFIEVARKKRISTTISTNLSLRMSDDRLRDLIKSGLNHMIVSLDGATSETAGVYRRKGDFNLVIENMRRIVQLKHELGSRTPYIIWRFLVFRFNEHELSYATRLASDIGVDRFTVAPAFLDEGDFEIPENDRQLMKNWVPTDPRMSNYDPEESAGVEAGKLRQKGSMGQKRARCDWHYTSTAINADGAVAPCCAMFYKKDDFGKISDSEDGRYMNIVNNSKFVAIRNHFSGRYQQPTGLVCDDCPAPNIMDYAKTLNRWVAYITLIPFVRGFARLFRILRPRSGNTISGETAIDSPVPVQEVKVSRTPI